MLDDSARTISLPDYRSVETIIAAEAPFEHPMVLARLGVANRGTGRKVRAIRNSEPGRNVVTELHLPLYVGHQRRPWPPSE